MIRYCTAGLLGLMLSVGLCLGDTARAEEADVAEFQGTVVPVREGEITPIVSAWLNRIDFVPGQYVEKGAVLFEFNDKPHLARIRSAEAQVAGAKAQLRNAEAKLKRSMTLKTKDVVSEAALEQALAERDIAIANVDQAQANLDLLNIALNQYRLKAPFAGVMSEPFVAENGWQDTGDDVTMATITQLDPIQVAGEAPYEIYAKRQRLFKSDEAIKEGLVFSLVLPDGEEFAHEGHLVSGGYKFDEATQKLKVWVEFPNPERLLRPGLRVTLQSRSAR